MFTKTDIVSALLKNRNGGAIACLRIHILKATAIRGWVELWAVRLSMRTMDVPIEFGIAPLRFLKQMRDSK